MITDAKRTLGGLTALVTGAGGEIGAAICAQLIDQGVLVVGADRDGELLTATATRVTGRGSTFEQTVQDLTDREATAALVRDVVERHGAIDILINNAGVLMPTSFLDITESEWNFTFDVNLDVPFRLCQLVLPSMMHRGWGRIVNMSSTAGKSVSTLGGAHYTASKAALLGLTRHLARTVAGDGVTVNAVCPGLIDTAMSRKTVDAELLAEYAASFPVGRLGTPSEVATLVAFLCSHDAAYMTGASIDINGGDLLV